MIYVKHLPQKLKHPLRWYGLSLRLSLSHNGYGSCLRTAGGNLKQQLAILIIYTNLGYATTLENRGHHVPETSDCIRTVKLSVNYLRCLAPASTTATERQTRHPQHQAARSTTSYSTTLLPRVRQPCSVSTILTECLTDWLNDRLTN